MKSIQTKFIFLILGCVLLSSTVIGGVGIFTAKTVVDEDSARIMNLLCSEKAQEINALLSRIEQSVNTLAVYAVGELDSVEGLRTDDAYIDAYTQKIQSVALQPGGRGACRLVLSAGKKRESHLDGALSKPEYQCGDDFLCGTAVCGQCNGRRSWDGH